MIFTWWRWKLLIHLEALSLVIYVIYEHLPLIKVAIN